MKYDYRKHQFFQMVACAMLMNGSANGRPAREIVNRAHEIWDEIETQCPEPKDEDRG